METNKRTKIAIVMALAVAVICLGIGFASFSSYLVVSSKIKLNPKEGEFIVGFSTSSETITPGTITALKGLYSSEHTATLTSTTITGIELDLEDNDPIEYNFYVVNGGKYDAYLNAVNFTGVECIAGENTTNLEAQEVCSNMKVVVDYAPYQGDSTQTLRLTESNTNINGNKLVQNSYLDIHLGIYIEGEIPNKNVTLKIGQITFDYSTAD